MRATLHLLVLLLTACWLVPCGGSGETSSCEENLQVLRPVCTDAYISGKTGPCCDFLNNELSQSCIADGSYDSLFASNLGKVLYQLLQNCPARLSPDAQDSSFTDNSSLWIFGVCLQNGTAELIWDMQPVHANTTTSSLILVQRSVGKELHEFEMKGITTFSSSPVATIAKYTDDHADCAERAVSYRLKFLFEDGGHVVATTAIKTLVRGSEHIFVSPHGISPSIHGCGSWSEPCGSLKEAATAQNASQVVDNLRSFILLPGRYMGLSNVGLDLQNTSIVIESAAGPAKTILDCNDEAYGISLHHSVASISGITLERCRSPSGAGIKAVRSALNLSNCILQKNTAAEDGAVGGALSLYEGSQVQITNSKILNNHASKYGAGIYVHNSVLVMTSSSVSSNALLSAGRGAGLSIFANSTVSVNSSSFSLNEGYFAGAIMLERSSLRLSETHFTNNSANYGGALVFVSSLGTLVDSVLEGNRASQYGGVLLLESAQAEIYSSHFFSNKATDGGVFYSSNSSISVTTSNLSGNAAATNGGVLAYVDCANDSKKFCKSVLSVSETTVTANSARYGGAFFLKAVDATFRSTQIEDNYASDGAGLLCANSSVYVRDSAIRENHAEVGGGVKIDISCTMVLSVTHLSKNTARSGGGLYLSTERGFGSKSALNLVNSSLHQNSADRGGAIAILGSTSKASIQGSAFFNNNATEGAGLLLEDNAMLQLSDCTFTQNQGHVGAAVSLIGSSCDLFNCSFQNNRAYMGAGINIRADLDLHEIKLRANSFNDNEALDGSSVFWSRKTSPKIELVCHNCTHASAIPHNTSFVSTEAIQLGVLGSISRFVHSTEEIPTFAIALLDLYHQVARTSPKHLCQISTASNGVPFSDDLLIYSEGQQESVNGTATYSGLRVEGKIGMVYELDVNCFSGLPVNQLSMKVNVTISSCKAGQEPGQDLRKCVDCTYGYYNFDGLKCKTCPQGGVCPGKAILYTEQGWWRAKNDSENLYMCPKPQACISGETSGDNSCTKGHKGPVCALCSNSFHEWGNSCRKCSRLSTYILPAAAILSVLFLVTVVLNASSDSAQADSIIRINILISYSQVLGRLNYYGMEWTRAMSFALGLFDYTNIGAKITAPRCIESDTSFYETYLFAMSVPFLIALSYASWYLWKVLRTRGRGIERGRDEFNFHLIETKTYCCRSVLWLLTLVYIGVGSMAFEIFSTRPIEGEDYLLSDYSITVKDDFGGYTERHKIMVGLGVLFLLLYPFGIPLFAYLLLRYCKRNPVYQDAVAFLSCGYKPVYYYWEGLEMLRNLLISIIPTVFPQNITLQNTLSQMLIVTYLVVLLLSQPYKKKSNLFLQCLQLFTVWILISGGALINYGNLGEDTQTSISSLLIILMLFTLVVIVAECVAASEWFGGRALPPLKSFLFISLKNGKAKVTPLIHVSPEPNA